jgi:hypothetical protein
MLHRLLVLLCLTADMVMVVVVVVVVIQEVVVELTVRIRGTPITQNQDSVVSNHSRYRTVQVDLA